MESFLAALLFFLSAYSGVGRGQRRGLQRRRLYRHRCVFVNASP